MPIIIIKAILSGLWKRLTALFGWAVAHPLHAALIVSLVACALLWRANERHKDERDRALATVERMIEAQKQATAFAIRAKKHFETINRKINDETDKSAADQRIVYRDRVMRLPTASSAACRTDLPEGGVSQGIDGSSSDTVLLARSDALICADNTARLEAAHDWALKMQGATLVSP